MTMNTAAYDEVVRGRRSIRGYKSDPVPRALVREVLDGGDKVRGRFESVYLR